MAGYIGHSRTHRVCSFWSKHQELWPLARPNFLSMRREFISYSHPIRFVRFDRKSMNYRPPVLEHHRGCDSWCWPNGAQPLTMRMGIGHLCHYSIIQIKSRCNATRYKVTQQNMRTTIWRHRGGHSLVAGLTQLHDRYTNKRPHLFIPPIRWEQNKSIGRAFLISPTQHRLDRTR